LVAAPPNSCLVLRNASRPFPAKYPSEVTIPIGYAVEGFHVLQTFAGAGDKPIATLQMVYGDGTTHDVKLIGDVNARDWAQGPSSRFPHEKETATSVAWTGSSETFPVITVYKMLWVNPRPDVPVRAIRYFKTPDMISVHALMGLTALLKKDLKPLSPEDLARVRELLGKAAAAVKSKDNDAAEKLFRQVLALAPKQWDAYQQLADLLEQKKSEEALFEHYQLWVRNGAVVPLPYNRVAEILEKKKDLRGALESYTRSLQVEWNQPPVIEAKKRLQNEVAK
jgi:hypothetical protein